MLNTYTINTHKEGEHINVLKVHLVCRVVTLCVADLIWGVCCDSYTLVRDIAAFMWNDDT